MYKNLFNDLSGTGCTVLQEKQLSGYSYFLTGGPCRILCIADNVKYATSAYLKLIESGAKFFVLGKCSNVLISDSGYDGVILKFSGDSDIKLGEKDILICSGGVSAAKVLAKAMYNRLTGAEFLGSIPGTLGGLVRMNAGCFGSEIGDIVERVEGYIDGKKFVFNKEECQFSYRNSIFSNSKNCIILNVHLKLYPAILQDIIAKAKEISLRRKSSQPIEYISLGSVFKRDRDIIPAQLIDKAGLKGVMIGGAQVSNKHAGFIVNSGNAKSEDYLSLIKLIKDKIRSLYGVELKEEIIYLE